MVAAGIKHFIIMKRKSKKKKIAVGQ